MGLKSHDQLDAEALKVPIMVLAEGLMFMPADKACVIAFSTWDDFKRFTKSIDGALWTVTYFRIKISEAYQFLRGDLAYGINCVYDANGLHQDTKYLNDRKESMKAFASLKDVISLRQLTQNYVFGDLPNQLRNQAAY